MPEPPVQCSICDAEIQGEPEHVLDSGPLCASCGAEAEQNFLRHLCRVARHEERHEEPDDDTDEQPH